LPPLPEISLTKIIISNSTNITAPDRSKRQKLGLIFGVILAIPVIVYPIVVAIVVICLVCKKKSPKKEPDTGNESHRNLMDDELPSSAAVVPECEDSEHETPWSETDNEAEMEKRRLMDRDKFVRRMFKVAFDSAWRELEAKEEKRVIIE